jgi:hypothetical protein
MIDFYINDNLVYRNQINELRVVAGAGSGVVSSCAGDGKVVLWKLHTIAQKMANLKI